MTDSPRTAVIAVGGNALSPPGEHSTIADQFRHTRESLGPIVDLALDCFEPLARPAGEVHCVGERNVTVGVVRIARNRAFRFGEGLVVVDLDLPGEVRRWAGVRTAAELVPVDAS